MSDEYPRTLWLDNWEIRDIELGMIICIESYVGRHSGHEGVKLKNQAFVTENGIENLISSPYEETLLG